MNEPGDQAALERALAELRDADPETRERAVRRLRVIGGPEALAAIMGALDDPAEEVRGPAAIALGQMEAREVVPALIERLRSETSDQAREICVFALGELRDPRGVQPLIDALQDSADRVVWLACHGLAWLGDPRAIDALLPLLDHPQRSIGKAACSALVRLGAVDNRIVAALEKFAQEATERTEARMVALTYEAFERNRRGGEPADEAAAREEASPKVLDDALADLQSGDVETRGRAIDALSGMRDAGAAAALIRALNDPEERIRCGAIRVLSRMGAPEAVPALIERLIDDPSAYVRRVCAQRCDVFSDERMTTALIQALADPDWEVQRWASAALGNRGDTTAIAPLLRLLDHPEREVRWSTAWALLKLKAADRHLVSALERLSKDPEAEEYDLEVDEWNCDLEKHRQMARDEGWPEPGPRLKVHELVEQARQLLAQSQA